MLWWQRGELSGNLTDWTRRVTIGYNGAAIAEQRAFLEIELSFQISFRTLLPPPSHPKHTKILRLLSLVLPLHHV